MALTTTIYFVRHGDVENPDQLFYGRLPGFPLSERGREQAEAAARHLRSKAVRAIYASPQRRTQETGKILQSGLEQSPPLHTEPLIDEIKSRFDGATQQEMDERSWNFYREVEEDFEQPADILARMRKFIQRMRRDHQGEEIVAVSHADPIVFIWMWVLEIPLLAENRRLLDQYGLRDDYPAKASISTFHFQTDAEDERPSYSYARPY